MSAESLPAINRPLLKSCSRVDIDLLQAVEQGGDRGELSRRTGLRAGSLDRQLDRLDRTVGLPVTKRGGHQVGLSRAGREVLAAGRRFFGQVDLAVATTIFGRGHEATSAPVVLDIASTDPMIDDMVEDVAGELDMFLSISHREPNQAMSLFADYQVAAALTWWFTDPRAAVDRPMAVFGVLDEPLWAVLPRTHRLAEARLVSLADLAEDRWITEIGPTSELSVAGAYQAAGLSAPSSVQVASASVARGMLRLGEGIGLSSTAAPANAAMVLRPIIERPCRTVGLLVDPTVVPRAVAERLAAMLTEQALERLDAPAARPAEDPWWSAWRQRQTARLPAVAPAMTIADLRDLGADHSETLDVADFHLLEAVAEYGSINRAATVLSISQSALTRRIHRLEQRLNAQLLVRSSQGTELTAPTRMFLRRLTVLEAEFQSAIAAARTGHRNQPVGDRQPATSPCLRAIRRTDAR